jgi:DNA repair protein RadC
MLFVKVKMLILALNKRIANKINMNTTSPSTIKMWAEDDRPREKMTLKGRRSLSDAELIAILIGSGTREKSAVDLSKEILNSVNNNLNDFAKLNLQELCKFKGIGEAKAISIIAAMELSRRRIETLPSKKPKITGSQSVYNLLRPIYEDVKHEEFHIIILNRANEVVRIVPISSGGVNGTVVDNRMIFKAAIEHLASGIILTHNHPSNNSNPSLQDIEITKKLIAAGKLLEIPVIDHVIYTETGYYSFVDKGEM